ncbi:MAG: hypothetical protein AAGA03_07665 [Planctomycetota bacterium]
MQYEYANAVQSFRLTAFLFSQSAPDHNESLTMRSGSHPMVNVPTTRVGLRCCLVLSAATILGYACVGPLAAAEPGRPLPVRSGHRLLPGNASPGAIGQTYLASGRSHLAGYFQPVAFSGPKDTKFALSHSGSFLPPDPKLMAGLLIGNVYRFRISEIPGSPGAELFPTVELIDRTFPPPGLATRYPIPINLDEEDLEAALSGQMVTRVIYLEDPQTALAIEETPTSPRAIDISEQEDELETADRFGRPLAIVRIGSLTPPSSDVLMPQFFFGYPTWAPIFAAEPSTP